MTAIFLAMKPIVTLGPHATGQTLLSKKMEGVPEALESLSITAKSLPVIAILGEQARSHLGSGARQGTEQIMIGMKSEKLLDAPSIEAKLLLDRKKHLYQTQSQEALGFHNWCGASKFGRVSEDLHPSRPLVATPEPTAVQEVLPLALAGLHQRLGSRRALQKHPGRDTGSILKSL